MGKFGYGGGGGGMNMQQMMKQMTGSAKGKKGRRKMFHRFPM